MILRRNPLACASGSYRTDASIVANSSVRSLLAATLDSDTRLRVSARGPLEPDLSRRPLSIPQCGARPANARGPVATSGRGLVEGGRRSSPTGPEPVCVEPGTPSPARWLIPKASLSQVRRWIALSRSIPTPWLWGAGTRQSRRLTAADGLFRSAPLPPGDLLLKAMSDTHKTYGELRRCTRSGAGRRFVDS